LLSNVVGESFAASAAGKVLDASAVASWASGHLGMQTWFGIAWELQLSFYLPAFARNEAMLLHPSTEALIETLARAPYVVLADLGPESGTFRGRREGRLLVRVGGPGRGAAVVAVLGAA
jgi:hypothetical protein